MMSRAAKGLSLRLRIIEVAVRILLPVLAAGLLATGVVGVVSFAFLPLVDTVSTRHWVAVDARVESLRVIRTGYIVSLPLDLIKVSYSYEYDGERFESSRFGPHDGLESRRRSNQFAATVRADGALKVWVDAAKPARATVQRDLNWSLVALSMPALVFVALGLTLMLISMVIWNDRRSLFGERGAGRFFLTDTD